MKLPKKIAILLCSLTVIPFLIICFYNHPLGVHEWDWITNNGGRLDSLSFWGLQEYYYNEVMGRYASTFISSLTQYWYSIFGFKLFFVFHIVFLLFSIYIFFKTILETTRTIAFVCTGMVWAIWVSALSGVFDTLYMLTSVHTYLFGFISFILSIVVWSYYRKSKYHSTVLLILLCVLSVFTIGTNELSMVYLLLFTLVQVSQSYTLGKKWRLGPVIVLSLVIIFSCIEALSPGNFARAGQEVNLNYSFIQLGLISIVSSLYNTISLIVNGNIFLACLSLFILLSIDKNCFVIRYSYRELILGAVLITLLGHSLIIIATGGTSLAERVVDLISLHLIVVMMLFVIKVKEDYGEIVLRTLSPIFLKRIGNLVVIIFFLSVFFSGLKIDRNKENNMALLNRVKTTSNISNVLKGIVNGDFRIYDKAMMRQYEELSTCSSDTCLVLPPPVLPKELYYGLNDRRNNTKKGDPYIGYYFNPNIKVVMYLE